MFILIVCIRRNPKMTMQQFQDYWLKHGELFMKYAKSHYNAVRYVQYHTIDTKLNDSMRQSRGYISEKYDGIGEIWWESENDFIKAVSSDKGKELREMFSKDEGKFIDLKNSIGFFTKAHILLDSHLSQIPACCICKLTGNIMSDPVMTVEGYSYERAAIEKHFESSNISPHTGKELKQKTLIANIALKETILNLS